MSPMKGRTTCAVRGCTNKLDGDANLCGLHKQPGMIVQVDDSTMVITSWLVRHGKEIGIVFLNDFALGDLHGGAEGFVAHLQSQGFTDIRLLNTLEELHAAKLQKLASWTGPWLADYPWQREAPKQRKYSDLIALIQTNVCDENHENFLMALVYSDCMIRTKYPDGDQIDINVGDRVNMTVEHAINLAKERVRDYCRQVVTEQPDITVHRRPAGLDNEEATRKWLESIPGIVLVEHPERPEGFGGPLPPAGQAG